MTVTPASTPAVTPAAMPAPGAAAAAPGSGAPRVRKDVARNRALLLATADRLIAVRGLDLTFHELAEAAGVGVGTVYRHFADKNALFSALIEQRFHTARDILLAAEQIEDPVEALRAAVLRLCEYQCTDRAMWQVMLSVADHHRDQARLLLQPISERIVDRARSTGRLRHDFMPTDLPMIFLFTGGLSRNTAGIRPDLWRRYVDATLDGFMLNDADHVGAAVPAAPTDADVDSIMSSAD